MGTESEKSKHDMLRAMRKHIRENGISDFTDFQDWCDENTGYRKAGVSADSASGNVKRWLLWKEMDGSCSGLQFKLRMASTNQQQRRKRAPFMVSVRLSRRDWKFDMMTEEEMQIAKNC